MPTAVAAGDLLGWVTLASVLISAALGLRQVLNFRDKRERESAAGEAFAKTVDSLADEDEVKQLAGAILLRRFFNAETEQGEAGLAYGTEALKVIAAVLRETPTGTLQKVLADGLAYSPDLHNADLQKCNLQDAFLGERPDRRP